VRIGRKEAGVIGMRVEGGEDLLAEVMPVCDACSGVFGLINDPTYQH
jgi:hypothetical protein